MLTRIEAWRFRSLKRVSLPLQRFHALVGPNGSGKSNLIDCVAFASDMVRSGLERAVFGGADTDSRAPDPGHLVWMRRGGAFQIALEFKIPEERRSELVGNYDRARYEFEVFTGDKDTPASVRQENLWLIPTKWQRQETPEQRTLFPSPDADIQEVIRKESQYGSGPKWRSIIRRVPKGNDYFKSETSNWTSQFNFSSSDSLLKNLPEDTAKFPVATWVRQALLNSVQRIALDSGALRRSSPPGASRKFLADGSNVPWVVDALKDGQAKSWIAHLQTALPDLRDVEVNEREDDRHKYLTLCYNSELQAPAWLVSDGTLRLLALTLLAYVPDQRGILLIEEPENGIHPRAIETVLQSLQSIYDGQVLCASHSPLVLGLVEPEQLLCFAKTKEGATDIVSGSQHPALRNWKGGIDLGVLFAAGVLGAYA